MLSIRKILESYKRQPGIIQLIYIYRNISLLFTSAFYLFFVINHTIGRKLFIIMCITVSSLILSNLYIKNRGKTSHILALIIIETMGNILILIPSGGIKSPYVWYCLNTILITTVELKKRYCWLNLFIYLLVINWISQLAFHNQTMSFNEMLSDNSNISMSLILVTVAMQLLSKYLNDLEEKGRKMEMLNEQLNQANRKIKKSMFYVMELYQTINLLSGQNDKFQVFELINQYSKKITSSNLVFFYSVSKDGNDLIIDMSENASINREQIIYCLNEIVEQKAEEELPIEKELAGRRFLIVIVKSNYIVYGILGIEIKSFAGDGDYSETMEQIRIISGLSSIVLQKIELENVNGRLLVAEEQNRIASEIHDSILQRMFNISCHIFSLIKQQNGLARTDISDDLQFLRNSIKDIMKDLRTAIYGLSWRKDGTDNFLIDMQSRINEIRVLSGIDIDFTVDGDTSLLSVSKKKALYRIICEGIGNAIHHGKATMIEVTLEVEPTASKLRIIDNGIGFDASNKKLYWHKGMGVGNIHQMTYSLNGNILLDSEIGKGTRIEIYFPNVQNDVEKIV